MIINSAFASFVQWRDVPWFTGGLVEPLFSKTRKGDQHSVKKIWITPIHSIIHLPNNHFLRLLSVRNCMDAWLVSDVNIT